MTSKEFGKLTAEQFKGLIDALPEVRRQGADMHQAIAQVPKRQLDALLGKDYSWACAYELTLHKHIALVTYALGLAGYLKELVAAPDPQQKLLDEVWDEARVDGLSPTVRDGELIGLVFSLQRTILSVMLYQRSMSSLVEEVREQDSHDALFKAVRVDRAVVAAPSIADRIARAELRKDEAFFRRLRSALRGPQKKVWEAYYDLRYAFAVLRELGFGQLSDAQLEHLLVKTLRVYPNTPSARKNLRAQYQQSRKISTL